MSFLRPAALGVVRQLAEPLVWAFVTLWSAHQAWQASGSAVWLSVVFGAVTLVCLAGLAVALQRYVLGMRSGGTGMVMIEEGRITYLGPFGGAAVAIDLLVSIGIEHGDPVGGALWRLQDNDGRSLLIPVGAPGAEKLTDTFAQLGGFNQLGVIRALSARAPGYAVIWRRQEAPSGLALERPN